MLNLIKFEIKKLIKKRTNIITFLICMLLMSIFISLAITRFEAHDKKGNNYKGLKAIYIKKEMFKEVPKVLTEETITKDIKEYQELFSMPENTQTFEAGSIGWKDEFYFKYINPKFEYFFTISKNYDKPKEFSATENLRKINLEDGAKFYETRENKVLNILNMNYNGEKYSQDEKDFWLNKNSRIEKPYKFGYYEGWIEVFRVLELTIVPILAICIIVAPSFAGEYQCGADAVILTSKYGKTKLITAKIIAAFIVATIVFLINIILTLTILLLSFGIEGWNLPLQINDTTIPYSYTFASATFVCIGISYIVMLGMVSITLLLSVKLKTPFSVLIIDVIILFIPVFLRLGKENGLFNHILYLLPYKALQEEFSIYLSYSFLGITWSLLAMRVIVYTVIAISLLPFIKSSFRKHQVQ